MNVAQYPCIYSNQTFAGPNVSNVVYVWTRNGTPCYVGVTSNFIRHRCTEHLKYTKKPTLFQSKLRAHTTEFSCYIVYHSNNYRELLDTEVRLIADLNTYNGSNPSTGYNLTLGGEDKTFTEATRKLIGSKSRGRKGYWTGKKLSKQHVENSKAGRAYYVPSEATREKLSTTHKRVWDGYSEDEYTARCASIKKYWDDMSEEKRSKMSNTHKRAWANLSEEEYKKRCDAIKRSWQKRKAAA